MPAPAVSKAEFSEVKISLTKHLTDCAEENRATRAAIKVVGEGLENIENLIRGFQRLAWRAFVGLAGIICTVAITILAQNFNYKSTQATKADLAHHTALQDQAAETVAEGRR